MKRILFALTVVFFGAGVSQAGVELKPTTTLAAETGNNTSAAHTFAGLPNGNVASTNVSKLPIRQLLYAGADTKIYVHMMPWFGPSNHITVGYDSADPAQAARQVEDMISRGIDGLIIDWYGPNSTHHNTASLNLLREAEKHPGFEVAITEDVGAVKNAANPTQQTIADLNYAWQNFMQSPAYMRRNGRPVVFFFGLETIGVDMAAVKAALSWNPLFIMRNSVGFTAPASDGAFAWLVPRTSDYGSYMSLQYINDFYAKALTRTSQLTFGSGFKGFDDTVAAWAPPGGRHIHQFCGQTWLQTFAEAGRYYSEANQLANLQIVTWNDYEEGTAIESGIDNCVSITSWMTGTSVQWSITGQENTIDHYKVFLSADGTNLMPVADVPAGTYALDLAPFDFNPGDYQVFVKAVGRPSLTNKMAAPVAYTVIAPEPPPPDPPPTTPTDPPPAPTPAPDWSMAVAPGSVQVAAGTSATMSVSVVPVYGPYTASVSFTCLDLPANMHCSFAPASLVPGTTGAATVVTVTTSAPSVAMRSGSRFAWTVLPAFGLLFACGDFRRRRLWNVAVCAAVLLAMLAAVGCGGGAGATTPSPASSTGVNTVQKGAYSIKVSATSGATVRAATATVIVN